MKASFILCFQTTTERTHLLGKEGQDSLTPPHLRLYLSPAGVWSSHETERALSGSHEDFDAAFPSVTFSALPVAVSEFGDLEVRGRRVSEVTGQRS